VLYWHTYKIQVVEIKDKVLAAARFFMAPIVSVLLRSGVTWSEFADLLKEVFVETARRDYGRQGRPTNSARVAMITGLSRREVTRVRDVILGKTDSQPSVGSRISQILTGWHTDPEFSDGSGQAKELTEDGDAQSLKVLLKRFGGDLPHGAITKELLELGLIEKLPDDRYRVSSRNYVRSELDPDIIHQMGVALYDHASTLAHNVDQDRNAAARFERIAAVNNLAPKHVKTFVTLLEERGQSFLEEMDSWLSRHAAPESEKSDSNGVRTGVGLYLVQSESRRGQES